jgi:hypothetical protein
MLTLIQAIRRLRYADDQRAGVPGEHWATFAAAVGTVRWAARTRSPLLRTVGYLAAAALAYRSVSGRDGLLTRLGAADPASPPRLR